jgi:hypothetical protein
MDFVEQVFGMSPDGGNGSLEALWILAALVAAGALVSRRRIRAWLAGRRLPQD